MDQARTLFTVIALLLAAAPAFQVEARLTPGKNEIDSALSLTLSTDKQVYLAGEPLLVVLTLTNVSGGTLSEIPIPFLADQNTDIRYRFGTSKYRRLIGSAEATRGRDARGNTRHLRLFEPERSASSAHWLFLDFGPERVPFEKPGEYHLVASYSRGGPAGMESPIRSRVVKVTVLPVPEGEQEAFEAWSTLPVLGPLQEGLGENLPKRGAEALRDAMEFMARYPGSVYAGYARRAVRQYLEKRLNGGWEITEDERKMYRALTAEP